MPAKFFLKILQYDPIHSLLSKFQDCNQENMEVIKAKLNTCFMTCIKLLSNYIKLSTYLGLRKCYLTHFSLNAGVLC